MRFTHIASVLFAAFGFAQASDDRLLFKIPSFDTMSAFSDGFTDVCTLWPPFNINAEPKPGFSLLNIVIEPGDFSGANADTEVKLVCAWLNGTTTVLITADVATAMLATPV